MKSKDVGMEIRNVLWCHSYPCLAAFRDSISTFHFESAVSVTFRNNACVFIKMEQYIICISYISALLRLPTTLKMIVAFSLLEPLVAVQVWVPVSPE